jgi:predicted Zn-ribbon and HTH transcriptional regulator
MESRPCRKCGYDLKGLRVGNLCPECGQTIRLAPKPVNARAGTMTDADPRYVRLILAGFATMSAGILLSIFGFVISLFYPIFGAAALLLGAAAWAAGVWIISQPRPADFAELENPILDATRSRLTVRVAAALWAAFVVLNLVARVASGVSFLGPTLDIGAGIAGLAAFVGLIPISIFVAELEFWMSDDTGGWQLRGAAWMMVIFGALAMVLTVAGSPFLAFWALLIVAVAAAILFWHIIGCVTQARWVLRYQTENEGRAERISQRVRDRTERGGTVAGSMPCLECGYELRGLPYGGRCPECGESYADRTPLPFHRALVVKRPGEDDPIDLDHDDHAPIQIIQSKPPAFSKSSERRAPGDKPPAGLTPEDHAEPIRIPPPPTDTDDDTPIPLAGDDEPDDLQEPSGPAR